MLGFHHVALQCADLEQCERFYREVLGLRVLRRWPREEGGDRSVWLSLGSDEFLALERAAERPEPSPAPRRSGTGSPGEDEPRPWRDGKPGLHLVALRIAASERAAWEDRLRAAGVAVVHRTRWTLYFLDPEGNRIGLTHHPHDAEGPGTT